MDQYRYLLHGYQLSTWNSLIQIIITPRLTVPTAQCSVYHPERHYSSSYKNVSKFDVFGCKECGAGKKLTTVGRDPRCGAVNLFIVLWNMTMVAERRHPHTPCSCTYGPSLQYLITIHIAVTVPLSGPTAHFSSLK